MLLTKLKFYTLLQLLALSILLLYQGVWLISNTTQGQIINFGKIPPRSSRRIEHSGTVVVNYTVNGTTYEKEYTRNGIPLWQKTVRIRYLLFAPSFSNQDSFIGQWVGPLIILLIFFLASCMLLLMHNTVFPKGTLFELSRQYPYIKMHEFLPYHSNEQ